MNGMIVIVISYPELFDVGYARDNPCMTGQPLHAYNYIPNVNKDIPLADCLSNAATPFLSVLIRKFLQKPLQWPQNSANIARWLLGHLLFSEDKVLTFNMHTHHTHKHMNMHLYVMKLFG